MAPQDLMESDDDELLKNIGQSQGDSSDASDDDSVSSSQASPVASQPKPDAIDASQYAVTADDLQNAQNTKRKLALIEGLTNAFANMKGAGSVVTGNNTRFDVSPALRPLMDQADQNIKNKQLLQAQAMKMPELNYLAQAQDKDSDISKASAAQHKALLLGTAKFLGKDNPDLAQSLQDAADKMDGMSAFDQQQLMDKSGLSKIASAESLGGMKNNQMMMALLNRQFNQDRNFGMKQDNQANQISNQFDSDSLMKQYSGQLGQIQKAKSLLQSKGPITHQTASELSQDLATILANGRAAGLEASNKQEYDSASGLMAQMEQWATAHPQDALPDAFRQQLNDQFDRLNSGVMNARSVRANTLATGRNFQNNPSAQAAMQAKVKEYGGGDGGYPLMSSANAGQGGSDKAAAALAEAQQVLANPNSNPDQLAKAMKVWAKYKQEQQGAQ